LFKGQLLNGDHPRLRRTDGEADVGKSDLPVAQVENEGRVGYFRAGRSRKPRLEFRGGLVGRGGFLRVRLEGDVGVHLVEREPVEKALPPLPNQRAP
jgi:hypothetical protein